MAFGFPREYFMIDVDKINYILPYPYSVMAIFSKTRFCPSSSSGCAIPSDSTDIHFHIIHNAIFICHGLSYDSC